MYTNLRIKIYNFFRDNKNKIFIGIIIITSIIIVNYFLGLKLKKAKPQSIYKPHEPVISGQEIFSKKTKNDIEDIAKQYVDYCNNKDYKSAYDMLSDDSKEISFNNNLNSFKSYIESIFNGEKTYSLQSYLNRDNTYIYNLSVFEDILATGMNTDVSDEVYNEKLVITKSNDEYKVSVKGFINSQKMNLVSEDDYVKVYIKNVNTFYDHVDYDVTIKNKTIYDILLDRDDEYNSITLSLSGDERGNKDNPYANKTKYIDSNNELNLKLSFVKYFDQNKKPTKLSFNSVRVLKEFTNIESNYDKELANAIKKYSLHINL